MMETLTWHCCMCSNPANGMVDIEELLAHKIQLVVENEMRAHQPTETTMSHKKGLSSKFFIEIKFVLFQANFYYS